MNAGPDTGEMGHLSTSAPLRRIHNERDRGFSAAVLVPLGPKSLVFVSGEIGRDSSGVIVTGGFEAEARQCFANIAHALARAGAGVKDVVRITAYLKNLDDYPVYAEVRGDVFGADWPASASVGVSDLLGGANLEVDAVAVVAAA
jgi:2-iminobutanoate/2-iminopropanoate deaminase